MEWGKIVHFPIICYCIEIVNRNRRGIIKKASGGIKLFIMCVCLFLLRKYTRTQDATIYHWNAVRMINWMHSEEIKQENKLRRKRETKTWMKLTQNWKKFHLTTKRCHTFAYVCCYVCMRRCNLRWVRVDQ